MIATAANHGAKAWQEAEALLGRFPKTRPPLPPEVAKIYKTYYKKNREGRSFASALAQRAESWLHRRVAEDVADRSGPRSTLEIGAGTLNQLRYEPNLGPYDIVEPFAELYRDSPDLGRVQDVYTDIAEIDDRTYDRITSVATFEHIEDLPAVIAKSGLLLAPAGTLRVSIPSEGSWLWALAWRLTTGLEFRLRYGLDHGSLRRHEHLNDAREIEELLGLFFADVRCSVFGLTRSISLYRFLCCRNPDTALCRDYLEGRSASERPPTK